MGLEQSTPDNTNKLADNLRKKIAPLILAGVSSFSAGQALGTEVPQDQGFNNRPSLEAMATTTSSSEAVTFSQENYQTINSVIPLMRQMISDFRYTTETDQAKLGMQVDASIAKIQECITRANKITDKKMAEFCSSKAAEIKNLMTEYRASQFKNEHTLNQAILIENIFSDYVDKYNEAYKIYTSTQQ